MFATRKRQQAGTPAATAAPAPSSTVRQLQNPFNRVPVIDSILDDSSPGMTGGLEASVRQDGALRSDKRALHDAIGLTVAQIGARLLSFYGVARALRVLGPERVGIGTELIALTPILALVWDLGIDVRGAQVISRTAPSDRLRMLVSFLSMRLTLGLLLAAVGVGMMFALRSDAAPGSFSAGLTVLCAVFATTSSALTVQWFHQGNDSLRAWSWIQLVTAGASCALYLIFVVGFPSVETYLVALAATNLFTVIGTVAYAKTKLGGRWFARGADEPGWLARMVGQARENLPIIATNLTGAVMATDVLFVVFFFGDRIGGSYRAALTMNNAVQSFVTIVPVVLTARILQWSGSPGHAVAEKLGAVFRWLAPLLLVGGAVALVGGAVAVHIVLGGAFAAAASPFALMVIVSLLNCVCLILAAALNYSGREVLVMRTALAGCAVYLVTCFVAKNYTAELSPLLGKGAGHALMATVYAMAVFAPART